MINDQIKAIAIIILSDLGEEVQTRVLYSFLTSGKYTTAASVPYAKLIHPMEPVIPPITKQCTSMIDTHQPHMVSI